VILIPTVFIATYASILASASSSITHMTPSMVSRMLPYLPHSIA
jgi:hypothetical protein